MSEYEDLIEIADRTISLATKATSQIESSEIGTIADKIAYAQLVATLALDHQLAAIRVTLVDQLRRR